jgi:hypothetical protein
MKHEQVEQAEYLHSEQFSGCSLPGAAAAAGATGAAAAAAGAAGAKAAAGAAGAAAAAMGAVPSWGRCRFGSPTRKHNNRIG